MLFSSLSEKRNQGDAGVCQEELRMSALLLTNAGGEQVLWVCEPVGLLYFAPEFDRLTYTGTDVTGQASRRGACLLGQEGAEHQCPAGVCRSPKGR